MTHSLVYLSLSLSLSDCVCLPRKLGHKLLEDELLQIILFFHNLSEYYF